MIRKNRDSKFIIYQVLYIFVITVLALKGADLDLRRVVSKEKVVDKTVRDSLVTMIDSLNKLGIKFNVKIDENAAEENKELKAKLIKMNKEMASLTEKIIIPPVEVTPKKNEEQTTISQSPLSIDQTFIKNTWNKARNTGNTPTYIYDPKNMSNPIAVIPPGKEIQFDVQGQDELVLKFGSQEQRVKVERNRPPEVKIARATTKMDSRSIYVQELQRVTGFTVTIIDERPDQLKVSYSGPISVTKPTKDAKGNLVYQVSLNLAPNNTKFDEWLDKNENMRSPDGKYKANFFFTVVDEKNKDRVQVGDAFYFTDYSK